MEEQIIIKYKKKYIHVKQYGKDNYEISLKMWQNIAEACKKYNCYYILGESWTEPISIIDGYNHIKIFELTGITRKHRIAWIYHSNENKKMLEFIETVLDNRGIINGRIFSNFEEAKKWLFGKS